MAHFIGYVRGNRGRVSRTSGKGSGLIAKAQGWKVGGDVILKWNENTQQVEVWVYLNSGSSSRGSSKLIGTFTVDDLP